MSITPVTAPYTHDLLSTFHGHIGSPTSASQLSEAPECSEAESRIPSTEATELCWPVRPGQWGKGAGQVEGGKALGWPQSSSAEWASCGGDVMAEECVGTEWGWGETRGGQESLLAGS